jgi:hypothetical protein
VKNVQSGRNSFNGSPRNRSFGFCQIPGPRSLTNRERSVDRVDRMRSAIAVIDTTEWASGSTCRTELALPWARAGRPARASDERTHDRLIERRAYLQRLVHSLLRRERKASSQIVLYPDVLEHVGVKHDLSQLGIQPKLAAKSRTNPDCLIAC